MTDELKEQEPQERVVEVGEWFNPFMNYEEIPYQHNKKDYRAKEFPFVIHPIGKFEIDVLWDREEIGVSENKALVVLPISEEKIKIEDFPKYEEKIETRLVSVGAHCVEEKYLGQNIPYQLEVRMPNEKVFINPFETIYSGDNPGNLFFRWREGGSEEEFWLLIPEVENILEKIQMRIVPIGENQNGQSI